MTQLVTGSDFRHTFRFENPVKTATVSGGQTESFSTFVNTRGLFEVAGDSQRLTDGQDLLVSVYNMYCYWRSELESFINKDTRIIYDNNTYRIESYERIGERRQYFHFNVSEAH